MSRNYRNIEHPAPHPVSSYEVAPDFFNTPNSYDDVAEYTAQSWREWKDAHPYKPGMVVWVEYVEWIDGEWQHVARKAFIADVFFDYDSAGWRRAKYRIHRANKKGDRFAQNWYYTWPGFIERGYNLAKHSHA